MSELPNLSRFFYDGTFYELDVEAARERDQDILLPDGRVLVVGRWEAVPKYSYSNEVAYHRPSALRERNISGPHETQEQGRYALAQGAILTSSYSAHFPLASYRRAEASEIERMIATEFGRLDYCILEEWHRDSYNPVFLGESDVQYYLEHDRAEVYAYLEGRGPQPNLYSLLCECVARGILEAGDYLISNM